MPNLQCRWQIHPISKRTNNPIPTTSRLLLQIRYSGSDWNIYKKQKGFGTIFRTGTRQTQKVYRENSPETRVRSGIRQTQSQHFIVTKWRVSEYENPRTRLLLYKMLSIRKQLDYYRLAEWLYLVLVFQPDAQ